MLILVVHTHRYGTDYYQFKSETYTQDKVEEFLPLVIKQFNIEYEEDRDDENLELTIIDESDIPTIEI